MNKKVIALSLCAVMSVFLLSGCSSTVSSDNGSQSTGEVAQSDENGEDSGIALDGTWPEETIKIGVEVYDTTDLSVVAYQEYFNYLSDYYNVEFMFSESISSAEDELNFVDSCAAAGCQGYIGGYNISMNEVVDAVTGYGMYYWGVERSLDEDYADNEYYLGGAQLYSSDNADENANGDYLAGYQMAYTLAEQGCQHVVFCNGGASLGIQMFMDRQEGFIDGIATAQEDGYEIVFNEAEDIIEGWPGTDEFAAAQSAALAKDYDGVAASFSGLEVWVQPIASAGKSDSIKLAGTSVVSESLLSIAESGQLASLIYQCEELVFGNGVVMIINAVNGHPELSKGDSGVGVIPVNFWNITNGDEFSAIYDEHAAGEYYITAQDLTQCFPEFNEDANFESIRDYYSSITMESVLGE